MRITRTIAAIILAVASGGLYARNIPDDATTSIASPTLTVDFPSESSLIQFFYVSKAGLDPDIEIYLTRTSPLPPASYYLDKIGPEGGEPIIQSAFTFDADRDEKKELFIIVRWEIRHPGLQTSGTYYRTYVYKTTDADAKFSRAVEIEERIGEGLHGVSEGNKVKYRYRDAASIRKLLGRPLEER